VIFEVDPGLGTAEQVVEYLRRQQVLCMAISRQAVRMVTHLDVSAEEVGIVCELLAQVDQNQLASPSLAGEPAPG
jgi:threonine aldolase